MHSTFLSNSFSSNVHKFPLSTLIYAQSILFLILLASKQYMTCPKLTFKNAPYFSLKSTNRLSLDFKLQIIMWICWILLHAHFPYLCQFISYFILITLYFSSLWYLWRKNYSQYFIYLEYIYIHLFLKEGMK